MAEEMEDPVEEIHRRDFEERMSQLQDVADADTEGTAPRDDSDSADDGDTARTPRRGAGMDEIQAFLEQQGQGHMVESIKKVYATNTRLQNEARQNERSLDDRVRDAVSQAMRETQAEDAGLDPDDPMAQVTPEQRSLFRRLMEEQASELGYVKSADLQQKEQQTWMHEADREAAESFGDAFGVVDDVGQVVLSDDAKGAMTPVYERLRDPSRGWTYADIYRLATFDDQIRAAEERGRNGQTQNTQERVQRLQRAQTERPGVPVTPQVNIRGERGSRNDTGERVMARALAIARRQIS